MEQAPSLTMNPSSGASTPRLEPTTPATELKKADQEKEKEADVSSLASTSTVTPDSPPKEDDDGQNATAKADEEKAKTTAEKETAAKTARERAFQYGLDKNNFETEVHQVMGTLNSWWGGVKKQSTSALWSIKADMDKAVSQAQADFEHLKTTNIEVVRKERADDTTPTEKSQSALEKDIKGKGKEKEVEATEAVNVDPTSANLPASTSNFLSRLSSSTAQFQNTLQSTLQSTIASAQSNPALKNPAQFRDQLAKNLHLNSARENLQVSMKQAEKMAEEYMKKGDQWVKDAEKWMGEAVKVVPPEEQERRAAGMSWDGSDWYSFTTSVPVRNKDEKESVLFEAGAAGGGSGRERQVSGVVLAGSRKDALLRRLREDKDLLLVDPESEDETQERREEFRKWVQDKWEAAKKDEREKEEGYVGTIRMALVPEQLSDEQFWQRYLFHKHMIEAEEAKRKAVLKASQQGVEDDFSWDDDAESETASVAAEPTASSSPTTTLKTPATPPLGSDATTPKPATSEKMPAQPAVPVPPVAAVPAAGKASTSTSTSPRDSEESYDLVSDQKKSAAQTEDDDSDWE